MQEVKTHPKQFYHTFAHFGAIGWEGCNMYYLQQQKKKTKKYQLIELEPSRVPCNKEKANHQ